MAKKKKRGFFGKLFSTIILIIVLVVAADVACFFLVTPKGTNIEKAYNLFEFKRYESSLVSGVTELFGDYKLVNYYKYTSTSTLGSNVQAAEFSECQDKNEPWITLCYYSNEADCKEAYDSMKAKQKENNEKAKQDSEVKKDSRVIVRRGTVLAYGNLEGVLLMMVCPF